MIINYICIILGVILLGIIINAVEDRKYVKLPFRESMSLFNVPFITFKHENLNLRFMIDTGSNDSYLNESIAKKIIEEKTAISEHKSSGKITTGSGTDMDFSKEIVIAFSYDNHYFLEKFSCVDFNSAFKVFEGFEVHGILGNTFLKRYKYQIDFNKLIAKSKHGKKMKS